MRRRTQRILISLLAFLIAGFAMANAYTFEVLNWSPFGILNLEKLILKKSPTSTGIILDGKEYTIKIDPEHESEGAIRVDTICDESGNNCKEVSELGIGGGGAIVIEGNAENFCYKKNDTTLICNNEFLRRLIESRGLGGSINIDGQDRNYCYRLKDTNTLYCDNSDIPSGNGSAPGNGKITIMQGANERNFYLNDSGDQKITLNGGGTTNGAIAYGSGEYICVKNGDNLDCSKAKLGELKPDKRCTFDGTSINCTGNAPTGGGNANNPTIIITQGGVEKGHFTLNQATDETITLDAGGNGTTIVGNSGQRCKYICDKTEGQGGKPVCVSGHVACFESEPTCQGNCNAGDSILLSGSGGGRCRYGALGTNGAIWNLGNLEGTIKTGIICTEDAPTGGDGLRESSKVTNGSTTSNNELLHPKSISQDLYISGDIYHDGAIKIQTLGAATAYRVNDITIHSQGVSIGEWPNKNGGLGVHGPIAVGKYMTQTTSRPGGGCSAGTERNTISIYASGAAGTDNFEILGSPRILVGVKNGGYLYFDNNNKLGINTTGFNSSSTLTVNGPIKIGNDCTNRSCGEANKGEIRYYEANNVGHFVGCTKIGNDDYQRRDLSIGNNLQTVSSNNNCNTYNTPYNSSIYETTIAQQTICN